MRGSFKSIPFIILRAKKRIWPFNPLDCGSQDDLSAANAFLDKAWYRTRYPDVAKDGMDPVLHFLKYGRHEGRQPCALFNSAWYCEQYDVDEEKDALTHYMLKGTLADHDPHPLFCAAYYRAVAMKDTDRISPLQHYLSVSPDKRVIPTILFDRMFYVDYHKHDHDPSWGVLDEYLSINPQNRRANAFFDPIYYYEHNNVEKDVDPLVSFCRRGAFSFSKTIANFDLDKFYSRSSRKFAQLNPMIEYFLAAKRFVMLDTSVQRKIIDLCVAPSPAWRQTQW